MIRSALPAGRNGAIRIGLIADTHCHAGQNALPDAALEAFAGVDLIVCLGDMGEASALDRLSRVAPVLATRGGDDAASDPRMVEGGRVLTSGELAVAAAFELGTLLPGAKSEDFALPSDVAARLRDAAGRPVAAVTFAATHAPALETRDGVLFVNPGSATLPAAGARTVAILELGGAAPRARIIELP